MMLSNPAANRTRRFMLLLGERPAAKASRSHERVRQETGRGEGEDVQLPKRSGTGAS